MKSRLAVLAMNAVMIGALVTPGLAQGLGVNGSLTLSQERVMSRSINREFRATKLSEILPWLSLDKFSFVISENFQSDPVLDLDLREKSVADAMALIAQKTNGRWESHGEIFTLLPADQPVTAGAFSWNPRAGVMIATSDQVPAPRDVTPAMQSIKEDLAPRVAELVQTSDPQLTEKQIDEIVSRIMKQLNAQLPAMIEKLMKANAEAQRSHTVVDRVAAREAKAPAATFDTKVRTGHVAPQAPKGTVAPKVDVTRRQLTEQEAKEVKMALAEATKAQKHAVEESSKAVKLAMEEMAKARTAGKQGKMSPAEQKALEQAMGRLKQLERELPSKTVKGSVSAQAGKVRKWSDENTNPMHEMGDWQRNLEKAMRELHERFPGMHFEVKGMPNPDMMRKMQEGMMKGKMAPMPPMHDMPNPDMMRRMQEMNKGRMAPMPPMKGMPNPDMMRRMQEGMMKGKMAPMPPMKGMPNPDMMRRMEEEMMKGRMAPMPPMKGMPNPDMMRRMQEEMMKGMDFKMAPMPPMKGMDLKHAPMVIPGKSGSIKMVPTEMEKFFASMSPRQKELMKVRGYLAVSDLTPAQRTMFGDFPKESFTISYRSDKHYVVIKNK